MILQILQVQWFIQKIGSFYEYINDDKTHKDTKKDENKETKVVQEEYEQVHVHTYQLFNEIIKGVKSIMDLKLNGHSKEFDLTKKTNEWNIKRRWT